jgi:hypothetical protein
MCKKLIHLVSFVLVLTAASSTPAGLVGYWAFDEGSGTSARDGSGSNNHGTLMGNPQWVDGHISKALRFDGVDDWVEVPHRAILTVNKEVTVSAWIYAQRHTGPGGESWQGILAKGESPRSYSLYTEVSGALHFSTAGVGTLSTTTVPLNQWVHVAAMVQNGQHKYYINGEPAGTAGGGITLPGAADTYSVMIGRTHEAAREFLGVIDEVRIYDRSLTAEQVRGLFNGIAPSWLKAENPTPPNGAASVTSQLLSWSAGETAKLHNVYFGTSPTPGPAEFIVQQVVSMNLYWHKPGLVPGTTYYWRIDEVEADGTTIHTGDVWSFAAAALTAHRPNPPDGATYVSTNPELSWSTGAKAVLHDVYFGTSQTDVANGTADTFKTTQTATTYQPGPLLKDTTYYWRIDEVEPPVAKQKGDVWRFKTVPDIPIGDPNLVGWWKLDEGQGTVILDWSGHDNHGTAMGGPRWVAGYDGDALQLDGVDDYVEVPHAETLTVDREVTVMAWMNTQRHGGPAADYQGIIAKSNDPRSYSLYTEVSGVLHFSTSSAGAYVGSTSSEQVPLNEWVHVAAMVIGGEHRYYINGEPAGQGGGGITLPGAADTASVLIGRTHEGSNELLGMIDDVRVYNKALTQQEIRQAMRGDTLLAWDPSPANGYTPDIDGATPLSWKAGDKAAQHDVYFGTDEDAVKNANASDTTGIYRGQQAGTSYTPPAALQWGQTYYWRIDQRNTDGTVSTGRVWTFTVANYLVPDDFEAYDDYCNRIFYKWTDGWGYSADPTCTVTAYGGNGTGSTVGNLSAPFAEQTIVHGGSQSMPFEYNNTGTGGKARYSEAQRQWASPQDWTRNNGKALTLYFYGDPANAAEQLYVAVEDSGGQVRVANHPDRETIQARGWQEWNIPLTDFAGVNLKMVKKMYIGVGNRASPTAGGSGKLCIDDIRVYPSRCVLSKGKPAADLSGDCVVDYADVELLTNLWLSGGFQITPLDPGTSGLIAHYPFNGNANDVVGGHNGTTTGVVAYTTGKIGQAILLDGVDDMVTVGAVGVSGAAPRTIGGWARANATSLPAWIDVFGFVGPQADPRANMSFDIEHVGDTATTTLGYYGIHIYGWEHDILPVDLDWHHLAASYDGTTIRWYGDGRLMGSDSSRVLNTRDQVHMGKRDDNENYFPGRVDEVRIYNRALSEAEVAWLAGHTLPLSIPADLHQDDVINFKDFAVLADSWLNQLFWP